LPEKVNFALLEALPVKGPWTCTVGLIVSTLVVVPAMGDSTAVTDPLCPERPERGSGVTGGFCGWAERDKMNRVPRQRIAPGALIRKIGAVVVFRRFISRYLVLN
jgi:hypothetical protein